MFMQALELMMLSSMSIIDIFCTNGRLKLQTHSKSIPLRGQVSSAEI